MSEAAHVLGCTQPTVSHHLAALERHLGTALCVRGRRGIELTDRGAVLLDHAELILTQIDVAERLEEGTLRIGTFATAGASFLRDLLTEFRQAYPGVRLTLTELDSPHAAAESVRHRRLDVAVVFTNPGHWLRPLPGIAVQRLFTDPYLVALPERHSLSGAAAISVAELGTERWVAPGDPESPVSILLNRLCADAGFAPDVAFHLDDYSLIGACVSAGLGVALVPQLATARLSDGVILVPLTDETAVREISALSLADGSSVSAVEFKRTLLRVRFSALPD